MKLLPGVMPAPTRVAAASSPPTRDDAQHHRWLAELERAGLAGARMRSVPANGLRGMAPAGTPTNPARPATAGMPRAQALGQGVAATADDAPGPVPTCEAEAPARPPHEAAAAARVTTGAVHAQAEPLSAMPLRPSAWGTPGPTAVEAPAGLARAVPATARAVAEAEGLPPACVHLADDGTTVSVVLRDPSLDSAGASRLRERLAARCREAGLALADLIVNGVPVEPVTREG